MASDPQTQSYRTDPPPSGRSGEQNRAVCWRSVHGRVQRSSGPSSVQECLSLLLKASSAPLREPSHRCGRTRGFSIFSPFERVAKDSRPTSIPTAVSFCGRGEGSYSTEKQAYHFPVEDRRIVRVLIVPSIWRWRRIFTSPIFERWR